MILVIWLFLNKADSGLLAVLHRIGLVTGGGHRLLEPAFAGAPDLTNNYISFLTDKKDFSELKGGGKYEE